MSENIKNFNVCETLLSKKLDSYNSNENDFIASGEITVTITLAEYRELVESKARKNYEIDKANEDKWKRENENAELKKEIERLKFMMDNVVKSLDFESAIKLRDKISELKLMLDN